MGVDFRDKLRIQATLVANEFIDSHMAAANGEYVKVYLFLLRHQAEEVTVSMIADGLNHTEADVKRALAYWEKAGVLEGGAPRGESLPDPAKPLAPQDADKPSASSSYSLEQVNRLAGDEDFSQLLYIAQKYMSKVFTSRECQVFAYLYDGLHMSCELLEYVVEHCVQGGHTSIRYIEKVALSWHEAGLDTVDKAKTHAASFTKDSFAVMKAFGLNDRKPGDSEKGMIDRWFKSYGFTRDLVVEACNRTLDATHAPSFKYADKILSEWKKAGVRTMADVKTLDEKRMESRREGQAKGPDPKVARQAKNQFHNFKQRETDYDALILQQLQEQ